MLLGFLFLAILIPSSKAYYTDLDISSGNSFSAASLDLSFSSGYSEFTPNVLNPGGSSQMGMFVVNNGSLSFAYSLETEVHDSRNRLCKELDLDVIYKWYSLGGNLNSENKYSGDLLKFVLNHNGKDMEMSIPNSNPYYSNSAYEEFEHWYEYLVRLPEDADDKASNMTCDFKIKIRAWKEPEGFMKGFFDEELLDFSISSGEWVSKSE